MRHQLDFRHESPSRTAGRSTCCGSAQVTYLKGFRRIVAYGSRTGRPRYMLTMPAAGRGSTAGRRRQRTGHRGTGKGRGRRSGRAGGGPSADTAAAVPVRTGADVAAPAEGRSRQTSREGGPIPDSDSRGLHAAGPVLPARPRHSPAPTGACAERDVGRSLARLGRRQWRPNCDSEPGRDGPQAKMCRCRGESAATKAGESAVAAPGIT